MTGVWRKLGRLYDPAQKVRHEKLRTHAANPLPVHLRDDVYRVYYSGRDIRNRSSVGAVDIDIIEGKVLSEHYNPFFIHGPKGSFFADGVSVGNCYNADGRKYMLFMGWQAPDDSHWRGDIGRLEVLEDYSLVLDTGTPFISTDETDPISLSYPWVWRDEHHNYRMWYGTTQDWDAGNGEMLHTINHALSTDGQSWKKTGLAVPYQLGLAQAFSRPTVLKNQDDKYEMWFSYRGGSGKTYRIGYAWSLDGNDWFLELSKACLDVSRKGWDSEMVEYPFVLEHKGERYMLYNGNGFGMTGFGLAVWESR
jgi:hypothetical protein